MINGPAFWEGVKGRFLIIHLNSRTSRLYFPVFAQQVRGRAPGSRLWRIEGGESSNVDDVSNRRPDRLKKGEGRRP